MAASVADASSSKGAGANGVDDPFIENGQTPHRQAHIHRYSSRYDLDYSPFGATNSPTQVKKALEAHLVDTERRLHDTKTLGESLLAQQSKLQEKLREVEDQQDEAEITPELKEQLKTIGQEHDDVSREIARSLLAPKSRTVSGEEQQGVESSVYTSQASGSPTKISAPSRRQRNQPTSRTADVQFAADISVSLLAQVRALQAAVAERDEMLKGAHADRLKLESNVQVLMQRTRTQDENEQRYKDENWNLETQNHELLSAARDSNDKEKKLSASLAAIMTEKTRLLNDLEETRLAHEKLTEEHSTARKAHETELHSLKKDVDSADTERATLHGRIEELTSQNQELARAISSKYRNITPNQSGETEGDQVGDDKDLGTPEHSPPPSPTKGTPRHGGLESETLRSSLHHAHRQIQNLKSNIHREKTEKIELKRMLQDARDELEQNRSGLSGASKRQKVRSEGFKRPARPEMLGGTRRTQTDVEIDEEEWEDHSAAVPGGFPRPAAMRGSSFVNTTDMSDAYQTAHETENDFETADERNTTESDAFETGAESLAGDSSEDLTETEDNVPRGDHTTGPQHSRPALAERNAGNRSSYYSTASTSGDDDDDTLSTPIQPQPSRFRLRNGRSSYVRQSQAIENGTPDSVRTTSTSTSLGSPATITAGMSPPATSQSLFAELGGADDVGGSTYGTPARSSVVSADTPGSSYTPSKPTLAEAAPIIESRPLMVDSGVMTEAWQPQPKVAPADPQPPSKLSGILATNSIEPVLQPRPASPSDFPLPPSVPTSPARRNDTSTQYTPQRFLQESPMKNTAFITPPKTTWDEAHEAESPLRDQLSSPSTDVPQASFEYSRMLTQQTHPIVLPPTPIQAAPVLAFSSITTQDSEPIIEKPGKTQVTSLATKDKEAHQDSAMASTTQVATGAAGGFLAGAAAALGFGTKKEEKAGTTIAEDESSESTAVLQDSNSRVLQEVTVNTLPLGTSTAKSDDIRGGAPIKYSSNDQGAQTMLTAQQIEQALKAKASAPLSPIVAPAPRLPTPKARSPPPLMTLPESESPYAALPPVPAMSPNRPASSSSQRTSVTNQSHPPLPQDYRTNIARANSLQSQQPTSQTRETTQNTSGTTIMGPPLMPASAMRRPHTPGDSIRSITRDAPPSRASQSSRVNRGTMNSQLSRRSSVSSFASELDERFNIRTDGQPAAVQQYHGPITDPRMIQAITQTMIGEYLWKYTRRAGSKEMSNTRHRRYFWVHPYNKTLHWSDHDPQTAGNREAKSKGVVIESVRVVTDDNPMPPGLHRKSLEITTPGRKIKITASTGQRHETWFNALSYLLLRGDPADAVGAYATGGNVITRDDLEEFTLGGYNARLVPSASRLSMSSYNSRTTSNTAYRSSRQPMPSNVIATNMSARQAELQPSAIESQPISPIPDSGRSSRTDQFADGDRDRTIRAKSLSRISRMFGSVTSRQSHSSLRQAETSQAHAHRRQESDGSIYDASIVSGSQRDSAEELRQEMLREEEGGLENVRACCDGKHDVSSLMHGSHRHGRTSSTFQNMTDRLNRSVSRRT